MANQQQDQNSPGKDRESGEQPMPGKSPGQTIPGQGKQHPRDQGKQNQGDQSTQNPWQQGDQTPRDQGKNPGMPQRDPPSPASSPGTNGDPPYEQPGDHPDKTPDVTASPDHPGRPNPRTAVADDEGSNRSGSDGKSGNASSQGRK